MDVTEDQPGLFDVPELTALPNAGRAEAGLVRALREAADAAIIGPADAALAAGALVMARALDRAEAMPDKSAVYALAQAFPPYQKALHGLRLPAELAPAAVPPTGPDPTPSGLGVPDWLSDELGPS